MLVVVTNLAGGGSIQAQGGNSLDGYGNGGGGRIAVYAGDYSGFNLANITALGGAGYYAGGAGTVYLRDTDEALGTLIIDAGSGGNGWTPLGLQGTNRTVIPDLVVIRGAKTHVMPVNNGWVLEFRTNLTISGGAQVSLTATNTLLDAPVVVSGGAQLSLVGGNTVLAASMLLDKSQLAVQGDFTIPVGASVIVSSGSQLSVGGNLRSDGALVLSGAWQMQVGGSWQPSSPLLISGATLQIGSLVAPSVTLTNHGLIAASSSTLLLDVAGAIVVDATSLIQADAKGNGPIGSANWAGGSYGGIGGTGSSWGGGGSPVYGGAAAPAFGDYAYPEDPGRGGTGGPFDFGVNHVGGGAVVLRAAALQLDGGLVSDGGVGGSGGGIMIDVSSLTGGGYVRAKGGDGYEYHDGQYYGAGGGGGGGGRIAVYARSWSSFATNNLTVPGGVPTSGGGTAGTSGSIWIASGVPHTHARFSSPGSISVYPRTDYSVPIPTPLTNGLAIQFNKPINTNWFSPDKFSIQGPLGAVVPTGISQVGDRLYRIAFPPQTENGYYHFTLLPTLLDAEGFQLDQNANGLPGEVDDAYIFTLILDTVPPQITHHEPAGDVAGTVSSMDVWFSEALDTNTLNTARVTIRNPTNGTVAATSVVEVGLNRWRISFPGQTATGTYQVSISTNVTDLAGNPLTSPLAPLTFNLVPVDLQLSNVTVSTNQLTAGDAVTISWTGRNATGAPLLGDWTDAIYLSTDNRWDLGDIRVASVAHAGGLSTNQVYTAQTTFFVPGLLPGNYHLLIRADIFNQERETASETNNVVSYGPLPLTIPMVTPNSSAFSGTLTPSKPSGWIAIQLAPGQNLGLYLHGLGGSSGTELYGSFGSIPSRLSYDYSSASGETDLNRQDHQLVVTTPPAGGAFYVLVYGDGIGSSNPFQLFASTGAFLVTSITPDRISNQQPLGYLTGGLQFGSPPSGCVIPSSVSVSGAGFDETTSVQFIAPGGAAQNPTATHLISGSTLILDLSPTNWPAGAYNVRIAKAGATYTRTNAFTVVQNGLPNLQTHLIVPSAVGFNIPIRQTIWLEYTNAGDAAMPAPLLKLHGDHSALLTPDPALAIPFQGFNGAPPGVTDTVQVMAKGSGATPGTLQPGDSGRIPVYYIGLGEVAHYPDVTFSLSALTADDVSWMYCLFIAIESPGGDSGGSGGGSPICRGADWHIPWSDSFAATNRPDSIPLDAWLAISTNLRTQFGPEWGNYVETLANDMNYLKSVGQDVTDVGQLWNFEVAKASASLNPVSTLASSVDASAPSPGFPLVFRRVYGQSIISRYHLGPLGRGWSHNWEVSIQVATSGNVTVLGPSGSVRLFTFKNGRFYNSTGDYGVLTSSAGAYRITETDQTVWQFRTDNLLDYVQDNNSNRITCGYTSGRLTTLTHSSGKQFLLDYDGNGRLWHLTDPLGSGSADDRVTTYQYDTSGEHLLTVTKPGSRTTSYTYITSTSVLQRFHALTSTMNPDKTTNTFAYDGFGRLTQTAKGCCGGSPITFLYDSNGKVTVVDATSRTNVISYGLEGQIAQVRDGAGRIVNFSYDGTNQLTQLLGPSGEQYRYSYGPNGNLTAVQDPLRHSSSFAFDPVLNRLTQVTDARYNSMQYRRDSQGNVTSIVYADNSHEDFGYDGYGDVLTYTNRRGSVINYAYNSAGQLTNKHYLTTLGRVDYNYTYDSAGNLRTAIGPEGTNSLDYYPDTDWLQRIAYPGGKWFTFEYDAVGRRTKRTDQDGNVEGYVYDAQGRLDTMTNGMGQLIVNYQYDDAGRLHRKTLGNGVYTTYDYNSAGQVTNLTSVKADSTVLSAFAYGYDQSGRRTSMRVNQPRPGLPGGSWTESYGYDPLGQLTSVDYSAPPNGTPGVSSVTYAYDAAGNRTQVQGDGGTAFTDVYAANALNQYSSAGAATLSYDADGNLTTNIESSVATAYGYDAENRLVTVTTPTDTWTYTYDSFGNRIATTHSGATRRYVIDPVGLGNVAAEYDGGGSLLARYDHGFGLLDRVDATSQPAYYTFSAIGHTAELTDSVGAPLNTYAFDPWGSSLRKVETTPNSFEYTGEFGVMHEKNGLESMRGRFYEEKRGRFVQPDPISIAGGMNLYRYTQNAPTLFADPSGLRSRLWDQSDEQIGLEVLTGIGVVIVAAPFVAGAVAAAGPELLVSVGYWATMNPTTAGILTGGTLWFLDQQFGLTLQPGFGFPFIAPNSAAITKMNLDIYLKLIPSALRPFLPPDSGGSSQVSTNAHSFDPNDKRGPNGVGSGHFVRSGDSLSYQISFENEADATAPARLVTITDVLDASLDLNTFELTEIAFGSHFISIPVGLNHYESMEFMGANGTPIAVDIQATLDFNTRALTVVLSALDPTTGWYPEDPLVGLLYPEDGTGRGTGSVTYRVRPLAGLPSGTVIRNRAIIVFDYNDPIQTPEVFNTLDVGAPTSSVQSLPALSGTTFQIQWSGQDDPGGIGLADYTIFASADGTNYIPWLQTGSSGFASFRGTPGNTYFFYSIARDLVGNAQPVPVLPQAVTTIPTNAPVLASVTSFTIRPGDNLSFTNQVLQGKPVGGWLFSIDPGAPAGASVNPTNGVFHWTPTCGQASTTNLISVRVTDSGWTNMTDAVSFTVTVSDCVQPGLGQQILLVGSSGRVPIYLISSVPLTNLQMTLVSPSGRLVSFSVQPIVPQICATSITPLTNSLQRLNLMTCANQFLIGTQQVAWLDFTAATNQPSAFAGLQFTDLRGYQPDGTPVANFAPQAGRVVVVGEEPLLECVRGTNAQPQLILYGKPGMTCAIEWRTNLVVGSWVRILTGLTVPTNLWLAVSPPPSSSMMNFYRAYGAVTAPTLTTVVVSNQVHLTLCGQPGKTYTIEYTTNQANNGPWFFMADISLTTPCLELGSLGTNSMTLSYRAVETTNSLRLVATLSTNQVRKLTLCGEPGKTYGVEYKTSLSATTPWVFLEEVAQTNACQELSNIGLSAPVIFYRAYAKVPSRVLQMSREGANYVIEWPAAYLVCGLEETATLSPSATWLPSAAVIQQSGDKLRATVPVGTTSKFYRLRCSQ